MVSWTCVIIKEQSTSLGHASGSAMARGTARRHRSGDRDLVSLSCPHILANRRPVYNKLYIILLLAFWGLEVFCIQS